MKNNNLLNNMVLQNDNDMMLIPYRLNNIFDA